MSSICLAKLVNALQTQKQRQLMREEWSIEYAFQAKAENSRGGKYRNNYKNKEDSSPACSHCKKTNNSQQKCRWRPDVKCRKCGNLQHMEVVCKSPPNEVKVVTEQYEEDLLVITTCLTTSNTSTNFWLIDSGCTSHRINDQELFKKLDITFISKVKFGNGEFILVNGK